MFIQTYFFGYWYDYIFDKLVGDALSNRKLRQLIEHKGYDLNYACALPGRVHLLPLVYSGSCHGRRNHDAQFVRS